MQDSSLLKNLITKKRIKCVYQENSISQFPYYLQIIKQIIPLYYYNMYQYTYTCYTYLISNSDETYHSIIFVYRYINRIEN